MARTKALNRRELADRNVSAVDASLAADTSADRLTRWVWREYGLTQGQRIVPDEVPVALTFNGGTYAVMMATPHDLEDFAVGFSLNEGLITAPSQIRSLDEVVLDDGIELRLWIDDACAAAIGERRRRMAGPTGCGLCGVESIAEATRTVAVVRGEARMTPAQIMDAMRAMPPLQKLNVQTRAVHAAAYWTPAEGITALREDVGRHNALDKLSGALSRRSSTRNGAVLLTSRVSVEMVQKTAAMGVAIIVAVSTPTALAVRVASNAGITLVAIARRDGFEVFTHPRRIFPDERVRQFGG